MNAVWIAESTVFFVMQNKGLQCRAVHLDKSNKCSISNIIHFDKGNEHCTTLWRDCTLIHFLYAFVHKLRVMKQKHTVVSLISQTMTDNKLEGFQTFIYYQKQYKTLHRKKMSYLKHLFFLNVNRSVSLNLRRFPLLPFFSNPISCTITRQ